VLVRRQPLPPRLARLAQSADLVGRVDLLDDDMVYTFCYGLFRPRVCVTLGLANLLGDDELLAVLRHEAHHSHYHEPLRILISRTIASGLFFLPVAGALRNAFLAGKEVAADRAAVAAGDDLSLARALVKMLHTDCPSWPAGVLAIGSLSPTELRLHRLLRPAAVRPVRPRPWDWLISATLLAGVVGFSHGAAAAVGAAPVQAACATRIDAGVVVSLPATVATTEFGATPSCGAIDGQQRSWGCGPAAVPDAPSAGDFVAQ